MSLIRNVVKDLDDTDALQSAQKEALEALYTVGDQQAQIFLSEIMESIHLGTDRKIPVTTIIGQTQEIRAMTSKSMEHISSTVTDSIGDFLQGSSQKILDGVGKLLSTALSAFFGSSTGSIGKMDKYYVVTNGLSVIRFDVKCWYRNIQCKSLYEKAERVTCIVGTKSVVDLSKIDFSTFVALYSDQLAASGVDREAMMAELKAVKEIYHEFQNITNVPAKLDEIPRNKSAFILPG